MEVFPSVLAAASSGTQAGKQSPGSTTGTPMGLHLPLQHRLAQHTALKTFTAFYNHFHQYSTLLPLLFFSIFFF